MRVGRANLVPNNFNWGYYGSGAQQLAIALLADAVDFEAANRLAGRFMSKVIGGLPDQWTLTEEEVVAWVEQQTVVA